MTATKDHLHNMFEYVRWADAAIIRAACTVPDAGYYKEQGISIGSIHKLLVHCMAAQWIWLSRWRGECPTCLENHEDFPTRDSLEQRWPLVHSAMLDFLGLQSQKCSCASSNTRTRGEKIYNVALGDLMLHVIDHGSYHRGQINTMIKHVGGTPGTVAYHLYALEKTRLT